ncbi:MAG TPA: NAD-binding protein, partial [Oscillospiraceae bacterium]|nr:NAD-binding protein [Oscillospiraceae bacterium]
MKIVVIGAGKVGRALTEQLVREGHNIVVVDSRTEIIAGIENSFDVMGVVGNGASQSIQEEAGVQTSDLVISVTSSDEVNIL